MIDWAQSMSQDFEYYEVDPNTWKDKNRIYTIKSSSIDHDLEAESLGSASIEINDSISECYIRIYLSINQNGVTHKLPLGVFLVQTPSSDYDGLVRTVSMEAYTPLIELKEKKLPLGYAVMKDANILETAYLLTRNNCRAPVVQSSSDLKLDRDFVANVNDSYLRFIKDLLRKAKYEYSLDENGRIMFSPIQEIDKLQPIWTFSDDDNSILNPEINIKHDLYGVPNVVEVISYVGSDIYIAKAVNNDPNSPTSVINRGREILYRETSPKLPGSSTSDQIDEYAKTLLKNLSSVDYTITYTHGYCPVRIGDCVRLNYKKAGLVNVKAKIISQSIKCDIGCTVSETAVFTKKLWE